MGKIVKQKCLELKCSRHLRGQLIVFRLLAIASGAGAADASRWQRRNHFFVEQRKGIERA